MPSQVTNYQCPACTGPLHFSSASGRLECEYCESTYDVEYVESLYREKEAAAQEAFTESEEKAAQQAEEESQWNTSELQEDWGADGQQLKVYSCPSCGAELICDETTAATSCPYCDNPTVVPGQLSGALKPDYVIPFKLDKEAAVAALKKHYKGKVLLPKAFSNENHLNEVKGIYVPFWLFDGEADGSARFHATRTHVHRRGDEQVTITEHYHVSRAGTMTFEKIPVDASTKMPDDHMDSIEPYDYAELKPFSTAYLPGYLADKYDVDVDSSIARADERCKNSLIEGLRNTVVGYQTCTLAQHSVKLKRGKVHYALLPVWILNTKWQDKKFLFAMNGQTGKMVGDLPVSWGKFWAWFGGIAAGLAAILALFMFLL